MALGGKEKSYYGVWAGASGGWICDIRGRRRVRLWVGQVTLEGMDNGYTTLGKGYFIFKISNK